MKRVASLVLLVVAIGTGWWLWSERQWVVDAITVAQFEPSSEIKQIVKTVQFTDNGEFAFYASQPSLLTGDNFNQSCQRQEANSPILGCYAAGQIYLFDITEPKLDDIEEVTAAHETLHAVYERLNDGEKQRIGELLEDAYRQVKTSELEKRMAYYERTEPGERLNELHSIIGTEFTDIGNELEDYYAMYFHDRASVVKLHSNVQTIFASLSERADSIAVRVNQLAATINSATREFNALSAQLNQDIEIFNARAKQPGGFSSQSEFRQQRAQLVARSDALGDMKTRIQADIATYQDLIAQLKTINQEAESLNRSLDSTLAPTPTL